MKNEKTKVLVIFEDGRDGLETIAKRIKTSLGAQATVKTRLASEVAIAEILAADAYAFGVDDADAHAWSEIRRLLTGMNLAGRKAGFFTASKGGTERLKVAFAPAELILADQDLIAEQADGAGPWAKALIAAR